MDPVVVVDENSTVVTVIASVLNDAGHEVIGCLDLSQAEAMIEQHRPGAVVLELRRRNEYAGWSLLCRLRQLPATRGIPLLVTSGDVGLLGRYEQQLAAYGVSVLRKPFAFEALVDRVTALVRAAERVERQLMDATLIPDSMGESLLSS